jgi:hypothetical protein
MSKKHFNALAAALLDVLPTDPQSRERQQWSRDVQAIATVCKRFNPLFDTARFLEACGVRIEPMVRRPLNTGNYL